MYKYKVLSALLMTIMMHGAAVATPVAEISDICKVTIRPEISDGLRRAIGEDLGTTRGVACIFNKGQPAVIYSQSCNLPNVPQSAVVATHHMKLAQANSEVRLCTNAFSPMSKGDGKMLRSTVIWNDHIDPIKWALEETKIRVIMLKTGLPFHYFARFSQYMCASTSINDVNDVRSWLSQVGYKPLQDTKWYSKPGSCPEITKDRFHVDLPTLTP